VEELKREAKRFQLPMGKTKEELIRTILSHFDRSSPANDKPLATRSKTATGLKKDSTPPDRDPSKVVHPSTSGKQSSAPTLESLAETLKLCMEQQRLMMQQIQFLAEQRRSNEEETSSEDRMEVIETCRVSYNSSPHLVQHLQAQITEFGGTEDEDVHQWLARVERVARVHNAADNIILLAASAKLIKSAKTWYDIQTGAVLDSWVIFKREIVKFFDREFSFTRIIEKAKARRWNPARETFDQYAIEKLAMIQRLNLPASNVINMLIDGIMQFSLRATALTLPTASMEQFLDAMRRVAVGVGECDHLRDNLSNSNKGQKFKDIICKGCGKKGHIQKDCRGTEPQCYYCKEKGHIKTNCPKLARKNQRMSATVTQATTAARSASTTANTVAAVSEVSTDKFYVNGPLIYGPL